MEPEIRFFTSQHDGARLAYTAFGAGPVLLQVPRWAHCIEWMSKEPEIGEFYEKLARKHRVIILERRGTGASQRDVTDFSMAAHVGDLRSLVEHLKLERFALFGAGDSGGVCITYSVEHPDDVSHLILWGVYAVGWENWPKPDNPELERERPADFVPTFIKMHRLDWGAMARLAADATFPSGPAERQRRAGQLWTEWMSGEVALHYFGFAASMDVEHLLGGVQAPTLVLHRRNDRSGHPIKASKAVAVGIPDARFIAIDEGDALIPEVEHERALSAIESFLVGADAVRVGEKRPAGTAVILFADIVDSTALTERIGDAAFHAQSERLHKAMREALAACRGRVVEGRVLGDGVMAVFEAAKDAIAAAARCHSAASAAQLQLHIGIHAGDVIRDDNDVHGGAVNIAARIAAAAAPGETLVSDVVRALGRTSAGVAFDDRGEHALKGIAEPQRLFAVRRGAPA